ncbi:hypothetical protein [Phytopseudomonas dryadis]|uniref:DUF3077 domain-containing protein n=1 Tax=Phytopseudomonas dryadis TaxID=2487520 RepID=A0A4Q9QVK3_9GAMM|nr:hypothetical protein [Pseudomonas dryadis]TBU86780.1 hypothetical protein DNK44_22005 [Pseudomonas dryadis]
MKTEKLTFAHEFMVRGNHAVLEASDGVPVTEALEAAEDLLDAVLAGLRDLMAAPPVSHQATLVYYAAESAAALVCAAKAGLDAQENSHE